MSLLVDILSWVLLAGGGVLIVSGAVGLLRFPDFFARLHAVSVTETLGSWSVLAGLALQAGLGQTAFKLVLIGFIMVFTAPTATHALAKAALHGGLQPLVQDDEES